MKLLLALFAVSISCSWAATSLPAGCGDSFIRAANAAKPLLNSAGKIGVNKLDQGIKNLRTSIVKGDINALSSNFKNVGALGNKKLSTSTTNACLKRTFLKLQKIDEHVALQLKTIRDPVAAANLVCNSLNSKALLLNTCKKE